MLLSDKEILELGDSVITPFDEEMVQPSSIDVRLDRYFKLPQSYVPATSWSWRGPVINPSEDKSSYFYDVDVEKGESFTLYPGAFALASTFERVSIPSNLACRFEGKSSIARLGLFAHITAGFVDPGFSGHVTLELFNASPYAIKLYPGMKIGQLCFFKMSQAPLHLYGSAEAGSHYQGQRGPTLSRIHENFYIKDVYDSE